MKPTIHAFIISWSGRQADAEAIEAAVADHVDRLTVIHSDEQQTDLGGARWRRVPNEWFYGRKFRRCLRGT